MATAQLQRGYKGIFSTFVAIEFGVLGELRVTVGGAELDLGGPRQKALLARLLIARGQLVPRDQLVEEVYGAARSGIKALQVGIVRLRRALASFDDGVGLLESHDGGYLLRVPPEALDAGRFERALVAAERALARADPERARGELSSASSLRRGPALAEFAREAWARGESARLEELHLRSLELRGEIELALGAPTRAIVELEPLVTIHPSRERAWALLMVALYRSGRQADALAAYRSAREHLVDEHGIEPGRELRELQRAILLQEQRLTAPATPIAAQLPHPPELAAALGTGGNRPPFVGRLSERAALAAALSRCSAGERLAALIAGEPGIGKTRLAAELADSARAAGFAVLLGRCDNDLKLPFKPFVEVLGQLLSSTAHDRLQAHVREHEAILARLLPPLAVGLGTAASEPATLGLHSAEMNGLQYALFAAVAGLLQEAGDAQALMLVLEDLHWADRSSLLLLKHLLTTPTQPRLMVLGTYRSSELGPGHPLQDLVADLHREPGILRLELVGLLDAEVAELARLTAGDRGELRPAAIRALRKSTAGNPFFVTEVLQALLESGGEPSDWDPDDSLPLPASIRETVARRVARLGEEGSMCLAAAAVLGVTFDHEVVAQVLERPATEVLDVLEAAVAAGLLSEDGEQMAFRHALIAQTLYETLSTSRRRTLHRRAAEVLEERATGAEGDVAVATVARQWMRAATRGADLERARAWARRAGDDAIEKLAPQEAQRWYQQALVLGDGASDHPEEERCELLIELGTAQRQSGDPAFRDTLLEAARMAHRHGNRGQLVRAALANTRGFVSGTGGVDEERIAVLEDALEAVGRGRTAERARLLATLAGELSFTGDWKLRAQLSDEALAIAREVDNPQTLVHVLSQRVVTIWSPATLEERLINTAECRHAADLLDDPLAQFQSVHWRASACIESGAFIEAAECRDRSRRLAERLRQPTALWMASYDHANEAIIAGRLDDAEQMSNDAFGLGQASGQPDALLILASQLMVIRYEQGRLGETIELVAQSLEQNPRITGFRSVLALGYCDERRHAEAASLVLGDAAERFVSLAYDLTWLSVTCVYAHVAARLTAADAIPLKVVETLHELLEPWHDQVAYTGAGAWGLVEHYLGMLDHALGNEPAAARRLQNAVRRAEVLRAPIWATHSRLELARALMASGRRVDAERLLRETCREAAALGCRTISRDAGELLADATLGERVVSR